jgi:hypothetical protein
VETNVTDVRDLLIFGVKAGANLSNVYNSKGAQFNSDPKIGFAGGVFLAIPIGKYLGVQPEILFSQKGFQATGNILGSSYSLTRTTEYIDVPLLFAFKPTEFITLLAGPQYSYLLKQKDVLANSTTSVLQEREFANDDIRKNILGITGGVDFTLKHMIVSTRVGWDIQKNNGDGTTSTPNYKNVLYQLTVGYRFYN